MRLESLRVELRPRSSWEAVELGTALVRANARAIWLPWALLVVPVFALVNAAAALMDAVWVAWLLMWWFKPLFDRIPLFVLSRSVFGETPSLRQTLTAQRQWGWQGMRSALTWRRLGLSRALSLPVDLLEGVTPDRLGARRRVLGQTVYGNVALLTIVCVLFTAVLSLSMIGAALLLVPSELLMSESMRALWTLVKSSPPPWAQVVVHAAVWLGTSIIEPFYVGAGFGIYLNRRTQLEGWDIEIAFRRLRSRIDSGIAMLVLAAGLALVASVAPPANAAMPQTPASALTAGQAGRVIDTDDVANASVDDDDNIDADAEADDDDDDDDDDSSMRADAIEAAEAEQVGAENDDASATGGNERPTPLAAIFGPFNDPRHRFDKAVARGKNDPLLSPKQRQTTWPRRHPQRPDATRPRDDSRVFGVVQQISQAFGAASELVLWLLLAALVVVLALTARRWLPWLKGWSSPAEPESAVGIDAITLPDILPDNIASAARALWRQGRPRRALALLYRASVEAMASRAGVILAPGATESECLRASRRMPDADDRDAFAGVVRIWQYAAYAQRLPDDLGFETLLGTLSQRFGWAR